MLAFILECIVRGTKIRHNFSSFSIAKFSDTIYFMLQRFLISCWSKRPLRPYVREASASGKLTPIAIACLLLCTTVLRAQQRPADIDKTIAAYLERITYWGAVYKTPTDYNDSLMAANERLMTYMKVVCEQPATLRYSFPKALENGLIVVSSEDSTLRFYSWDSWVDPSLHVFNSLVQYHTSAGIKIRVLNNVSNLYKRGDPGSYFMDITTVRTKAGKTVYMATDCSIAGENKGYGVRAYTIEKDSLITTPFFRSGNKVTSSLDYAARENYSGDTTGGFHGQLVSLHFSTDKKRLFLPEISPTGILSFKYFIFKFNGEMFVYRKIGEDKEEMVTE